MGSDIFEVKKNTLKIKDCEVCKESSARVLDAKCVRGSIEMVMFNTVTQFKRNQNFLVPIVNTDVMESMREYRRENCI